ELARLRCEHPGDIVLHRIGQAIGLADELARVLAIEELALAEGAHQDFKQPWIDGAHRASSRATRRTRDRARQSPAGPTNSALRRGAILPRPSRSSGPARRRRTRGPSRRSDDGRERDAAPIS